MKVLLFSLAIIFGVNFITSSNSCEKPELNIAWSAGISQSSIVSTPILFDLMGDGHENLIVSAFGEDISLVDRETGFVKRVDSWPLHVHGTTTHSAPLLYDVDNNGLLEVMHISTTGQLIFVDKKGSVVLKLPSIIPKLYVKKRWLREQRTVGIESVEEFTSTTYDQDSIQLHGHVLNSARLEDLTKIGISNHLVVPVTFFTDDQHTSGAEFIEAKNATKAVCSAVLVYNLRDREFTWMRPISLSRRESKSSAVLVSSPLLVDLEGTHGRSMYVVLADGLGQLVVLTPQGIPSPEWSYHTDAPVYTTPLLFTDNKQAALVVLDTSGVVTMVKRGTTQAKVQWRKQLPVELSWLSAAMILLKINQDHVTDVVVASNTGAVFALDGNTGEVIPSWPRHVGSATSANLALYSLNNSPSLVSVSDAGTLYMLQLNSSCVYEYSVEDSTLQPVVVMDLVDKLPGPELLLATKDGSLICMTTSRLDAIDSAAAELQHISQLMDSTGSVYLGHGHNVQEPDLQVGLRLMMKLSEERHVSGASLELVAHVVDDRATDSQQYYRLHAHYAHSKESLLMDKQVTPAQHRLQLDTPRVPIHCHVTLTLTNQFGQRFSHTFAVRFNQRLLTDTQWLLVLPFLLMMFCLTFSYTLDLSDVLPTVIKP